MAQTIRSRIEAARKILHRHQQDHLLAFVEDLDKPQTVSLLDQIDSLDLPLLDGLIRDFVLSEPAVSIPGDITPAPYYPADPAEKDRPAYESAVARGQRAIAEHRVAAFTVAGGQGTRLNFDGPKGNVPASPVRNKCLFQMFAESIIAVQRRYNCQIPWYIMTSQLNHDATVSSFQQHDYFGLNPDNVMCFRQGVMPSVGMDGKILLAEQGQIAMNPDGHGGSLRALHTSGALADMARRGIEFISYFQIDNPLVQVIDPLFIGLHANAAAEMSSKAVMKRDPFEKVGNFGIVDGKVTVIEYSDLPDDLAQKRRDDGSLFFQTGSIAIHVLNRDFVERLNARGFSLPWHRAVKKVPHIHADGQRITPESPNAVKFETFVFDAIPLASGSIILEIDRDEEFAPIKNAAGADSLHSSQTLQMERAARWMQANGFDIPRKIDGTLDVMIEISPLFAMDAHELGHKKALLRGLRSGDIVYLG